MQLMNHFLSSIKKWFLLGLLIIIAFFFFYLRLYQYVTFEAVMHYQSMVQQWTILHYKSAVALYILIFTTLIACAIPCATLLALVGGFLFGAFGIVYAVLGTTLGGMILYLAVRIAIGTGIAESSKTWLKKIETGFQQNAFYYLLTLRLVPVFPCWISNISAGMLNIPIKTFLSATMIGIFPSTFIYVLMGRGLDKLFSEQQTPIMNIILSPSILFPLFGLAIMSLVPVFYKQIKKRYRS